MKMMQQRESDECPRCEEVEDAAHIWRCTGIGTYSIWDEWRLELEAWWRKSDTNPELGEAIITAVDAWRQGDPDWIPHTNPDINEALQRQTKIGWKGFLEGKWAVEWRCLYTAMGGTKNESTWAKTAIGIGWRTGWALWDQRNNLVHSKESEIANQTMNTKITELTEKRWTNLLADERRWADCTREEVMSWAVPRRQQWINRMEAILKRKERERTEGPLAQMRRTMLRFLENARNIGEEGAR
jgi:hypothetical protein